MEKSFRIKLKSGIEIEIHMKGGSAELSIDNKSAFKFNIKNSELEITTEKDALDEIVASEEIEYKTFDNEKGLLRNCIFCQGRTYCITRGCANTPCGVICD